MKRKVHYNDHRPNYTLIEGIGDRLFTLGFGNLSYDKAGNFCTGYGVAPKGNKNHVRVYQGELIEPKDRLETLAILKHHEKEIIFPVWVLRNNFYAANSTHCPAIINVIEVLFIIL